MFDRPHGPAGRSLAELEHVQAASMLHTCWTNGSFSFIQDFSL